MVHWCVTLALQENTLSLEWLVQAVGKVRTSLSLPLILTTQKLAPATTARRGNTARLLMPPHAGPARQANTWIASPLKVRAKDVRRAHRLPQGLPRVRIAHKGNIPRLEAQLVMNAKLGFIPVKVQFPVRVVLQVSIAPALLPRAQCVLQVAIHMHMHQSVLFVMQGTMHRRMQPNAKSALQTRSALRKLKNAHRAPMEPLQLREAQLVRR